MLQVDLNEPIFNSDKGKQKVKNNKFSKIYMEQRLDRNQYILRIRMDDILVHERLNGSPKEFENVQVWVPKNSNSESIIKNFEFTISKLNESLFLKEKVDHSAKHVQTDTQKPALLTFVKQLVSEFESYDGNEQDRLDIQEELKNYNEVEMLNCEITKLKSDDKPMTLKELMFSFFEYAKQKAISISYHK